MTWSQSVTPAVPSMSAEMKTFMNTSCGTAVSDPGRIRARASGYLLQPEHGAHLADGPSVMVADDGVVRGGQALRVGAGDDAELTEGLDRDRPQRAGIAVLDLDRHAPAPVEEADPEERLGAGLADQPVCDPGQRVGV